ncbi:MAG: hypothetical protein PF485_15230 [Bacteroidales bacterium]|jgi:cell division septum initiation protein DivIVA|nr:hypothetical protein [Bacteroidales bacterium]
MLKDLCIPVPGFSENEIAELHLKVGDKKISYDFRVESFLWDIRDELNGEADEISNTLARISRLKKAIAEYDKSWELIQIFTPAESSMYIQVLYRKKTS